MTDANELRAHFAPFALQYAELQALDAGDPQPALDGARRRAGWKTVMFVLFAGYFAFRDASGVATAMHVFYLGVASWFALGAFKDFRRLGAMRGELAR